tara:strand:+ start:1047 stop:2093 length:1047 start_codon:yes stop_codon:yes gene_type:complete
MPGPTFDITVLRSSEELPDSVWEPCIQSDLLLLESDCTGLPAITSAADIYQYITDSGNNYKIRARPGFPYELNPTGAIGGYVTQGKSSEMGMSICRSINVRAHPDKAYAFLVDIEYSTCGRLDRVAVGSPSYSGSPPIQVSFTSPLVTKSIYRSGATYPGDNERNAGNTAFELTQWDATEVGGNPIDIGGKPVPFPIDSCRITVEYLRRWQFNDWGNSDPQPWIIGDGSAAQICLETLRDFVGRRNLQPFMGFPIGTVKCDALNILPHHHEFKKYQFIFTYSADKHSQQYTPALAQGSTEITTSTGPRGIQAFEVYANQPYLEGFLWDNTNNQFGDDEWAYLQTFNCD